MISRKRCSVNASQADSSLETKKIENVENSLEKVQCHNKNCVPKFAAHKLMADKWNDSSISR